MTDTPFAETPDYDSLNAELIDTDRLDAISRYERCLAEQRIDHLQHFVEYQLGQTPVNWQLLLDVANDLQQRLLALREYHFDVRKRVVQALDTIYETDITDLAPADALDRYHLIRADDVVRRVMGKGYQLSEDENLILIDMVESSTSICAQLNQDIDLTTEMLDFIDDWLSALSISTVRLSQPWRENKNDGFSIIH